MDLFHIWMKYHSPEFREYGSMPYHTNLIKMSKKRISRAFELRWLPDHIHEIIIPKSDCIRATAFHLPFWFDCRQILMIELGFWLLALPLPSSLPLTFLCLDWGMFCGVKSILMPYCLRDLAPNCLKVFTPLHLLVFLGHIRSLVLFKLIFFWRKIILKKNMGSYCISIENFKLKLASKKDLSLKD